MYVSPAVRSICEHPTDGETVDLLLRVEGDVETVAERVQAVGATVDRELEFDTLVVRIDETSVGTLLDVDGVASIETTDSLTIGVDGAGEDVRPEDD